MNEVVLRCPKCGDHPTHKHCYVNLSKGVWHCHFCGLSGTVRGLVEEFPDLTDIIGLIQLDQTTMTRREPISLGATLPVTLPEQEWARTYLTQRGLTTVDMAQYRIKVSSNLPNRVVFPEYYGETVAFWAARSTIGEAPKWLFPNKGSTMHTKSESVWGLNTIEPNTDIWISEGIFDAIAVKGVCVYGKDPSNLQLQMILSKNPSSIVIALDRDAEWNAEQLQKRIKGILPVYLKLSRAKDYGVYLQKGYRRVIGTNKFRREKSK